ncbi:MAG: phosphocholine cytidylyltransferase family protein [Oscillospiraceae bacterium]|nr:phosphocholine cytidylyltransferase family protein [Oscillospiraceae bacterium]
MKALILAAGFGKRLRPLTDEIPKAMVEVDGTPLLVNALDNLTACGVTEIGIVVGHMADYIRARIGGSYKGVPIRYYENARYLETNNVVSLYCAADFCDGDMLLLECDLFYRRELLERLLAGRGDCSILVSPFNGETMDGTVIETAGDEARALILGKWQGPDFDYTNAKKTVNLYRFSEAFVKAYLPMVKWYVENVGENSYYEKVLGSLLYLREFDVRVVEVPEEMWCEIDDADDLERARRRFGA